MISLEIKIRIRKGYGSIVPVLDLSVDLTCENQETWLHSLWHDVGQDLMLVVLDQVCSFNIIDNNSFLHAPDQFKFKLLAEIAVE